MTSSITQFDSKNQRTSVESLLDVNHLKAIIEALEAEKAPEKYLKKYRDKLKRLENL